MPCCGSLMSSLFPMPTVSLVAPCTSSSGSLPLVPPERPLPAHYHLCLPYVPFCLIAPHSSYTSPSGPLPIVPPVSPFPAHCHLCLPYVPLQLIAPSASCQSFPGSFPLVPPESLSISPAHGHYFSYLVRFWSPTSFPYGTPYPHSHDSMTLLLILSFHISIPAHVHHWCSPV